jgi:hypothetical protein
VTRKQSSYIAQARWKAINRRLQFEEPCFQGFRERSWYWQIDRETTPCSRVPTSLEPCQQESTFSFSRDASLQAPKIQSTTPALKLESSLLSSPVDPVHVAPYHTEAGSEAALRTPQMSYKLKSFTCGMRIWTSQPTESESCLSLQAAPVQQAFEL